MPAPAPSPGAVSAAVSVRTGTAVAGCAGIGATGAPVVGLAGSPGVGVTTFPGVVGGGETLAAAASGCFDAGAGDDRNANTNPTTASTAAPIARPSFAVPDKPPLAPARDSRPW